MAHSLKHLFDIMGEQSPVGGTTGAPLGLNKGAMETLINTIRMLTAALETARLEGSRTYSDLGRSAQTWSDLATRATTRVLTVLAESQRQQTTGAATHERAEQSKSLATVMAMKQTAVYKALEATAAGFQALGNFDFWAAANDFTSAALWGSLAGTQIASMAGVNGGGQGRQGRSETANHGAGGEEASAGFAVSQLGAGAASVASGPSGHLTVAIMGDNEAGEWLASTLNTAVEQRGVQLTSTRSTRSTYAQG